MAKNALTIAEFIRRTRVIHGNKYDYSKVVYINSRTKVCIICKEHGEFWQKPSDHLQGCGCPKCATIKRNNSSKSKKTLNVLIDECKAKYGNRYDFTNTTYQNAKSNVTIFDRLKNCYITTTPTKLLSRAYSDKIKTTKSNYFDKARFIHDNQYDYAQSVYVNWYTKIKYRCPYHGIIEQLPGNHLRYGCKQCSIERTTARMSFTKEEFILKTKFIHGNKYDYSKVVYINSKTKVCIICPKHGEFWQTPSKHLQGHGCPKCNRSHLEEKIASLLTKNNIEFIEQYNSSFLKNGKGLQKLDFYLPKYKIAIECQGEQHFTGLFYVKSKTFKQTFERDIRKYYKCKEQGINVLYFTSKHLLQLKKACKIYNDDNIFADKQQLLAKILSSYSQ